MKVNEPKSVYLATGKDREGKLSRKELNFAFNLTKGRIAESLIQELFLLEGFQVYKYGLENNYQGLYKQLVGNKRPTAENLRKSPDLVVFDPTSDKINYLEIKFCSQKFYESNTMDSYDIIFPDCYFIIVTPNGIFSILHDELNSIGKFKFLGNEHYSLAVDDYF